MWLKAIKLNINKTLEMSGSASSPLSIISSSITVSLNDSASSSFRSSPFPLIRLRLWITQLFIDQDSQRSSSPHWASVHSGNPMYVYSQLMKNDVCSVIHSSNRTSKCQHTQKGTYQWHKHKPHKFRMKSNHWHNVSPTDLGAHRGGRQTPWWLLGLWPVVGWTVEKGWGLRWMVNQWW